LSSLTAKAQKAIYDGRQDGYVPIYADAKFFQTYLAQQVERTRATGHFGSSLKAVRNAKELARLGLRKGQRVLDCGSGGGILINQLAARYGVKGFGVDVSTLALSRARQCGAKGIVYKQGVLEKLPFAAKSFDAVTSFDVLEHVAGKEEALAEIVRVLKPGGKALIYAVSSHDALTWHWWLRLLSLGRLGHDTEAGHTPELMASPYVTRRHLEAAGAKVLRLSYLHSFFSLIFDEALAKLAARHHRQIQVATASKMAAPTALPSGGASYALLQALEPLFNFLEWPWKLFGLSNGFFILVEKPRSHAH
jgi:ubiquinone/menaquinone biosynthesis C-methylase UbiE